MRLITFWLIAMIVTLPLMSQSSKLDSLNAALDANTENDTVQLKLLLELAQANFGIDFHASERLANQAVTLATRLKRPKDIADGNYLAGRACIYLSKSKEGLIYFESAKSTYEVLKDTAGLADTYKGIAINYLNTARYAESIKMFEAGQVLYQAVGNYEGQAYCVMDIGIAYIYLNAYEKALEYYLKSLPLAVASGKDIAVAQVKNSIGQVYYLQEKYDESNRFMQESMEVAMKEEHFILVSDCKYYMAMSAFKTNRLTNALDLLIASYQIDSTQSNYRGLVHKSILFGDIYVKQDKIDEAEKAYENAARFCNMIQEQNQNLSLVLMRLSSLNVHYKEYDMAITNLKKAAKIANGAQMMDYEYQSYEKISEAYEKKGDFKSAIKYHRHYAQLKDSAINVERVRNFNQLQALYEDQQKQAEIERLNNESALQKSEIELQQANASRKTQQSILLLIGLFAVMAIAIVLWIMFKNKAKTYTLLSIQKKQIEKQNLQKEILLKEIHHRVKNNLQVISSLLSLQSKKIVDTQVLEAVKEGQNRVKSIALIHQKLYQNEDISRVDFDEYAQELVSYLRSAIQVNHSKVSINVQTNNVVLDIDTAVPLGLILNELVTNSLKYAFPNGVEGNINVSLTHVDPNQQQLRLIVADDGVGLPAQLDIDNTKSLGLKLVKMLCLQLDGKMTYSNGQGSIFDILISNTELRKSLD